MNGVRIAALVLAVGQVAWAQDAAVEEPQYARVIAKETQLRCFASVRSPLYVDRLTEGQVIVVGEEVGGYRQVMMPLGATGYVHKRFADELESGMVVATAPKVSFRYRPRTSEAPAEVLTKGAELYYLGEDGDWWRVLNPAVQAFLPTGDLQMIDQATDTVTLSYAELEKSRRKMWNTAANGREAVRAAAAELAIHREQLDALAHDLQAMAAQPLPSQDYGDLKARVAALVTSMAEESAEHERAVVLQNAVDRQHLVAEGLSVIATETPTHDVAAVVLQPDDADPLARFDASGWLHARALPGDATAYSLKKGGKTLMVVTCEGGRYDLDLFVGSEIGIQGVKSRPHPESLRMIEALKLEVLKAGR